MTTEGSAASGTPLVSVVVPCYNGAEYIRHAVRSALGQTYPNIEVIVVDDGSVDDSRAILETTFGDDIAIVSKPNGGPSAARNVGLRMANGEYVQFLDADNVLTPAKVARSVEAFAAEPDADIVFTAMHEPRDYDFTEATTFPEEDLAQTVERIMERTYELVFPGTGIPALETSQPLFRRNRLLDHGGWDETLTVVEDTELVCRMVMRGARIRHIPMVGVIYRDHPGDRVTNRMRFDNEAYFRSVLKMIKVARECGWMNGAVQSFSMRYLVWIAGLECVRQGKRDHARRYLTVAREISPALPGPLPFRAAVKVLGPLGALSVVGVLVNLAMRIAPRRTRAALGIPEPD
ncbi:glycosyltransferase [Micromonospora sp. WMMD1076]|uniref:glycosyltransferase family 2 protein n=1 Tax=Micromonospora TaxID=1873 RepID=UPI00249A9C4B|nr:glycosyltransferase [Micromonospora sp. WMMD1076]WFF05906.1 glycosyltransferase [Micromonospora sp. WMMD1076]